MSIDEMLRHSMIDHWYNIRIPEGVYNVIFHLAIPIPKKEEIKEFSTCGIYDSSEQGKIIRDMILYAAKHQQEKIYFRNNYYLFSVTIDVLETYD